MLYLIIKAALSGILIAIIAEVAKRYPGFGGLIASLPLVSVLGMIWLWRDKPDAANMAAHAEATFWFVLPSLPCSARSRPARAARFSPADPGDAAERSSASGSAWPRGAC